MDNYEPQEGQTADRCPALSAVFLFIIISQTKYNKMPVDRETFLKRMAEGRAKAAAMRAAAAAASPAAPVAVRAKASNPVTTVKAVKAEKAEKAVKAVEVKAVEPKEKKPRARGNRKPKEETY